MEFHSPSQYTVNLLFSFPGATRSDLCLPTHKVTLLQDSVLIYTQNITVTFLSSVTEFSSLTCGNPWSVFPGFLFAISPILKLKGVDIFSFGTVENFIFCFIAFETIMLLFSFSTILPQSSLKIFLPCRQDFDIIWKSQNLHLLLVEGIYAPDWDINILFPFLAARFLKMFVCSVLSSISKIHLQLYAMKNILQLLYLFFKNNVATVVC